MELAAHVILWAVIFPNVVRPAVCTKFTPQREAVSLSIDSTGIDLEVSAPAVPDNTESTRTDEVSAPAVPDNTGSTRTDEASEPAVPDNTGSTRTDEVSAPAVPVNTGSIRTDEVSAPAVPVNTGSTRTDEVSAPAVPVNTGSTRTDEVSAPAVPVNTGSTKANEDNAEVSGQAGGVVQEEGVRSGLTLEVAKTIRRLSEYLARESGEILNAIDDVLFCIRMAKGQLAQMRAESPEVYQGGQVTELLLEAEADLDRAAVTLRENFVFSPNFIKNFSFTRTLVRPDTIKRLDPSLQIANFTTIWKAAYKVNLLKAGAITEFGPDQSDRCMSQIQPRKVPPVEEVLQGREVYCPVDDACWLMTTKPGAKGYYLTHQLLFLLLGQNGGCAMDFEAQALRYFGKMLAEEDVATVTSDMMRQLCTRVLHDADVIVRGDYPDILTDLFVEQGFLCGAAVKMPDFFTPDRLRVSISWQLPSGCFGYPHPSGPGIDYKRSEIPATRRKRSSVVDLFEGTGNQEEVHEDRNESKNVENVEGGRGAPSPRREQVMAGSCYAHYTAVALGYFAVAMRYLTD